MKVIDTRRNSRPENRGQSERKYVCEPCAKELGAAVGQVSAEKHQRMWDHRDELGKAYNDVQLELESVRAQQTRVVSVEEVAAYLKSNAPGTPTVPPTKVPIAVPPASTDE